MDRPPVTSRKNRAEQEKYILKWGEQQSGNNPSQWSGLTLYADSLKIQWEQKSE